MTDSPGVAGLLDLSGRVAMVTGASGDMTLRWPTISIGARPI